MTLRLTLILSAVFLFAAFTVGSLFTTQACFLAGAGTAYPSLQQAIDRAAPGCTVILLGGTYRENVVIDKPLRIIPRSQAKPFAILGQQPTGTSASAVFTASATPSTLQAADPERPVIQIRSSQVEIHGLRVEGGTVGMRATGVRDVHLRNNTAQGSRDVGILLEDMRASSVQGNAIWRSPVGIQITDSQRITAIDNVLRRNGQGLLVDNASANSLQGNEISNSESVGLRLTASSHNDVRRNDLVGNATGLVIENASNNRLEANRIDRNDAGLRVRGTETSHYVHHISSDNTVNGRPIHYLVDAQGATIDAQAQPAYLALIRSRDVTVRGVALPEGSQGLLMISTTRSRIENVTISASEQGIQLQDSNDNALIGNRVERTKNNGITLTRSSGNRLESNVVRANEGHGLLLRDANANVLTANEVRANEQSGFRLTGSRGARLTDNRIVGNWVGVYLDGGGDHSLVDNRIAKSQFAIYVQGTSANQFTGNRLRENRHASNQPAILSPSDEAEPPTTNPDN